MIILTKYNTPFFNVFQEIKNQNTFLHPSMLDSVLLFHFDIKLYHMNNIHSDLITSNADLSLNYIVFSHVNGFQNNTDLFNKCIDIISQNPKMSFWYAKTILNGRFEPGEKAISTKSTYSFSYANQVLNGRFALGEEAISTDVFYSISYARQIIKGKFELGEKNISTDAYYSYIYAKYVLNDRFELGESQIRNNPTRKVLYNEFLSTLGYPCI